MVEHRSPKPGAGGSSPSTPAMFLIMLNFDLIKKKRYIDKRLGRIDMSKTSPAQFVRQVRQELKRITWATKRDTIFATITVLLMAVLASVFFFLVDLLLSSIVEFVLGLGT